MSMSGLRHAPLKGVLYMLAGVLFFSIMDATAKWLTGGYPIAQLIFIGRLPMPVFAIGLALASGGLWTLKTHRMGWHLLRAATGVITFIGFFWCLKLLPLADTVALTFASPLIQCALSVPLLGERVGPRRWLAIVVGFIGVIVIVQPSGTGLGLGALLALMAAFGYALFNNISRRMSGTETTPSLMLWYSLSLIVATGAIVPFQWVSPRAEDYGIFILFAAAGTVGQYLMTQAFRYGEASLLAPIDYSALIWATLLGFLFWQEFPTPTVFAGAAIIVASSLYILHRETRMARRPLEPAATAAHLPEA
ncbi:MAG: hypothetical protein QOK29_2478 [Rhodospirillaceae bacterium]|jgi:drug/metabolite transporter (DMT)-like permease|nr:hypothetical protein [Rhodospirillaceae bacterium]